VWNTNNAVFGSNRSAICAQAVYLLHLPRPSVTWLNSQWWLAATECCQRWYMTGGCNMMALLCLLSLHAGVVWIVSVGEHDRWTTRDGIVTLSLTKHLSLGCWMYSTVWMMTIQSLSYYKRYISVVLFSVFLCFVVLRLSSQCIRQFK